MNTNKIFVVIVSIVLLSAACRPVSTPTPPVAPSITPLPGSIGRISPEEEEVAVGSGNNLALITQPADFFNNNTVRVTNGGVAKLDFFGNQISIRVFNDTSIDDVKVDTTDTNNFFLRMKLVFGGLSGEVTKNGRPAQVELTNGVNIYILGTQFLVLYDPVASTTYIGNFDGTIAYSLPGRSVQFTQAGQLYEVSSNFEIKQSPLTFTRADIDNLTSNRRSTLLDTLKDFSQPTPTPTPTLFPTSTPTITPTPTKIIPCDAAAFVADVTIPDGTSFSPGTQFTKVWRLKNVGTCTWTNNYSLVFSKGDQMGGPSSVGVSLGSAAPGPVAPGQTVDVAVNLVAPALSGSYRGDWILRNSSGKTFGIGANGTMPIWVAINVVTGTIKGTVFLDKNYNGLLDQSEGPQSGVKVYLYADIAHQIKLADATTNTDGVYIFSNLNVDTYYMVVEGCSRYENAIANLMVSDPWIQDFLYYGDCGQG